MNPIQSIQYNDHSFAVIGNADLLKRSKTGLLILSPFREKRADSRTIDRRNPLVANLADSLYVPYATPSGNLSSLC